MLLAILMLVALGSPANATVELLGRESVTFGWDASPSPVSSYDVFVACAAGPNPPAFAATPDATVPADQREITIDGNYGDSCRVRISGRNVNGLVTPASDASEVIRFVAPSLPVKDFDGDGTADVVLEDGAGNVSIVSGDSVQTGSEIDLGSSITSSALPTNWRVVGTGDFDGDGAPEVLWHEDLTDKDNFWAGATPETARMLATFAEGAMELLTIGDFDDDGRDDVFFWERTLGLLVNLFTRDAGQAPGYASYPSVAASRWDFVAAGDLNGDGFRDLLWRRVSSGQTVAWLLNGTGRVSMMNSGVMSDLGFHAVTTGNFNNAKSDDVLWVHEDTGETLVWYLDVLGEPVERDLSITMGGSWGLVSTGDLNADGRDDLVWLDANSNRVEVWSMDEYAEYGYYTH